MPKSMPQSKQASFCITISMKHFTHLQHQSIYFNTNSPNNLSMKQESTTLQELTALNKRCMKNRS